MHKTTEDRQNYTFTNRKTNHFSLKANWEEYLQNKTNQMKFNEFNCSVTLCHSQSSKHSHPGVPLVGRVCLVEELHSIIGPVTQPQVLTNESNVLNEVNHKHHDGISPSHGTQVLEVHWELHLDVREKRWLRNLIFRFLFCIIFVLESQT